MPVLLPNVKGAQGAVQVIRPINTQAIAIGATATEFANVVKSDVIRVFSDVACHVTFDGSAAATTDLPIGAGFPEFIAVIKGQTVGVLSATETGAGVAGTAWVSEAW